MVSKACGRLLRLLACTLFLFSPLAALDAATEANDESVGRWADAFVLEGLRTTGTPGAVLVIVRDGRIVVAKGYGLADTRRKIAVDPQKTLFRIGSITKLFTALAALQMQEQGRLSLDRDVNLYLRRFHVPGRFPDPVTADNLLSHDAGFADDRRGRYGYPAVAITSDPAPMRGDEIARRLAPRVRPPGRYSTYDNHGFGLLALVESAIDRTSFRELMARRIFLPAGMNHSVIGLPLDRVPDAALGHIVLADGSIVANGYDRRLELDQGSGDVSTTGADMARFMIALLDGGAIDGRRLIGPAAFARFVGFDARRLHPALPGLGRAIVESDVAGHRGWRHDGGLEGFGASMMLYPQSRIGVFIAINARNPNPFAEERLSGIRDAYRFFTARSRRRPVLDHFASIHDHFAARFVPLDRIPSVQDSRPLLTRRELEYFAGTYGGDPAEAAFFPGKLTIAALGGRNLHIVENGDLSIGRRPPYRQVARGLFVNSEGDRIAVLANAYGRFMGDSFLTAARMRPFYASPLFSLIPIPVLWLLFLSGGLLLRASDSRYRLIGALSAAAAFIIPVGAFLEAQYSNQFFEQDRLTLLAGWRLLLWAASACLLLIPLLVVSRRAISGSDRLARLHAGLLAICAPALVFLMAYWSLLTCLTC